MKSIVKRLAVVLAAAFVSSPALAADRASGFKAQDDLAWPQAGTCATALVVSGARGLPQPDTTQAIVAGASPAVTLAPAASGGVDLDLVPDAPVNHFGISRESVRLAAR
jgi:hypothetical protein